MTSLERLQALPEPERLRILKMVQIRQTFAEFVKFAWPILEPGRPLQWNWHIDLICEAVQKQVEWAERTQAAQNAEAALLASMKATERAAYVRPPAAPDPDERYRRLAIFISPGDLKSVLISVFRPAWVWMRWPERRSLYFSHSKDVAKRDSRRTRLVLSHPAYRALVAAFVQLGVHGAKTWDFESDQNEKHNYVNTLGGHRLCFGFDQSFTGERGDDLVIDDPVDAGVALRADEGDLRAAFADANDIIANKMQSRVNDMKTATWTLMMQRLGEGDPGDIAIRDGDWTILCLPKEFNPTHPHRHPQDPRTESYITGRIG